MQDKFNICEHDSCTACSACQSICHKHAIRMITDDELATSERMNLIVAIQIVIQNALDLLGIIPREEM